MAKKNNKKNQSWEDDDDMYMTSEQDIPQDISQDIEEDNDFMSTIKKSAEKKKNNEEVKKPILKSKKEKEKEKKEREKQRKKELAAKKNKSNKPANNDQKDEVKEEPKEQLNEEVKEEPKPNPSKPTVAKKKKGPAGLAALKKQLELQKQQELEYQRLLEEEERKEREAQLAAEKAKEDELKKIADKKEAQRLKKEKLKAEGKYLTKKQKEEKKIMEMKRNALLQSGFIKVAAFDKKTDIEKKKKPVYGKKKKVEKKEEVVQENTMEPEAIIDDWEALLSDDDDNSQQVASEPLDVSEPQEAIETKEPEAVEEVIEEVVAPVKKPVNKKSYDLRSPICVILGHVDTGKTKLLDKIRQSNVQGGEAGGITQQIGATYFPGSAIEKKTEVMKKYQDVILDVPGLLIIDTPGHESFTNLRSRGSSLCNIAILVIDIMHGLEQQTIESIKLLRDRKAPFVVALNKIDRLFGWDSVPNDSFRDSLKRQSKAVKNEFESRLDNIKLQLSEQGLNSELYFNNKNIAKYVSIVPTSAVTGEGVPDLLWLVLELTQKRMSKQLKYLSNTIEATVLEVKVIEGLGTTIDVILSNGKLKEGDRIVICGLNGPIVTNIRALLTPQPLKEMRIKGEYVHHKEVTAALGVKIAANDLEKAVSGSRLLVVGPDDDEEELMDEVMDDITNLLDSVDKSGKGVVVQASTLGSLEALLDFLKDMKIPVLAVGLGPVYKRDVMKCATMLEKAPEFAVMLCFDVKVDKEAEQYAEEQGVKIFNAEVIYHLFDAFTAYQEKLKEEKRAEYATQVVYPCVLNTIQIINKRRPMIIGVDVVEGTLKIGTPICAVRYDAETKQKNVLVLGKVASLEINHESVTEVKKGQTNAGVAMRLDDPSTQQPIWGKHVDEKDVLYSHITRKSIDTLKDPLFRDKVPKTDWLLIKKLKPTLQIE
ncbi:related to Eukaryotic translation initiation factor 5B [Hanseniaspora guilliermondii]|uniref:Eukaryotic translation initiation factor 5B n=1 Tax=Hanseniaspora guilliermondii TaxID=56406 RepID=A0A1L0AV46_9ASCO|nr:related to Eukaryotic translation initiation factor 5B [Hanseniaspora guilliermondii]